LKASADLHKVYVAEQNAAAARLDFYKVSVRGTLEETVEAVKRIDR